MFKSLVVGGALSSFAQAAVLTPFSPVCNIEESCFVAGLEGTSIKGNVSVYSAIKNNTSILLAGYDLGEGSNSYYPVYDQDWNPSYERTAITGTLWLEINHDVVSVNFSETSRSGRDPLSFRLTSDALENAGGIAYKSVDDGDGWPVTQYGDIVPLNLSEQTCIECGWDISLNLVNLKWENGGFQFDIFDQRSLVFRYDDFYDESYISTYTLSDVPLPAASWLFLTGLLFLGGKKFKFSR